MQTEVQAQEGRAKERGPHPRNPRPAIGSPRVSEQGHSHWEGSLREKRLCGTGQALF